MAHVATITIDHTKVPGDLTDYVGLIVPDGSAGYSALYALCLEGGGDIRLFKSDDTTELAREIVTFSVSAETGEIHYKYSGTLSSSVDTDIHVYADGSSSEPAATATYGSEAVWVDYKLVTHTGATDSSGNETLTANGGISAGDATGQIGAATNYDGVGDYFKSSGINLNATSATMQAWLRNSDISAEFRPWSVGETAAEGGSGQSQFGNIYSPQVNLSSNGIRGIASPIASTNRIITGYASFAQDTTYMLHQTFGSTTLRGYLNGSQVYSGSNASCVLPTGELFIYIGARPDGNIIKSHYEGWLGEFRWTDDTLSVNWITTEYNNQNSPSTFYSVAAVAGGSTSAQAARRGVIMMM